MNERIRELLRRVWAVRLGIAVALLVFVSMWTLHSESVRRSQENTDRIHSQAILIEKLEVLAGTTKTTLDTINRLIAAGPEAQRRAINNLLAELGEQNAELLKAIRLRQQGMPATLVVTRTKTRTIVVCRLPNGRPCP